MDQNNNPWLKLTTAPIFEKGHYLGIGNYKLKEERCVTKQIRSGGRAWIVEFTVLESDNPNDPIGAKRTWYQEDNDSAAASINDWLRAMMGFHDGAQFLAQYAQHLPAIMNAAEAQGYFHSQPGIGTVAVSTHKKWTKKNKIFTVHDWSPWTPPQGWQPQPTPPTPAMPQADPPHPGQQALPYGGPPQGYQGYGGPPAPMAPQYPPAMGQNYGFQAPAPTAPQAPAWGPPAPGVPGGWPPPR